MVLDNKVLVLNRQWVAVNVINVRRALILSSNGKATVIDADMRIYCFEEWLKLPPGDTFLQSTNSRHRIPEVVLLTRFDRFPSRQLKFNRQALFRRDGNCCVYCGESGKLTVDHVIPRKKGGKTDWTNCVSACVSCNAKKADKSPEEAGMKRPTPKKPIFNFSADKILDSWLPFLRA